MEKKLSIKELIDNTASRPSRFLLIVNRKFAGSMSILSSIYDAINKGLFQNNLNDMEMEWCDELIACKAISYQIKTLSTTKTYIRLSKKLFENATRKELVETVLYEMLYMFVILQSNVESDEENDLQVYFLTGAINFLHENFDVNLKINHNFDVGVQKNEESSVPDVDMRKVAELLGAKMEFPVPVPKKREPVIQVLNKKLVERDLEKFKCVNKCTLCYCPPRTEYRKRFVGANIFAIYTVSENAKCILCGNEFQRGKINEHFDDDCVVFQVAQQIYNKFNL